MAILLLKNGIYCSLFALLIRKLFKLFRFVHFYV